MKKFYQVAVADYSVSVWVFLKEWEQWKPSKAKELRQENLALSAGILT